MNHVDKRSWAENQDETSHVERFTCTLYHKRNTSASLKPSTRWLSCEDLNLKWTYAKSSSSTTSTASKATTSSSATATAASTSSTKRHFESLHKFTEKLFSDTHACFENIHRCLRKSKQNKIVEIYGLLTQLAASRPLSDSKSKTKFDILNFCSLNCVFRDITK